MEVHLPCPPLREWLPVLLARRQVAVWAPRRAPRRLRPTLAEWPALGGVAEPTDRPSAAELAGLDALLFGVRLERPEVPEACLELLRPGTLIVELGQPRRAWLRELFGLNQRAESRATASQSRVLQWLARGYFDLEQWQTVEPHGVVVTLARAR